MNAARLPEAASSWASSPFRPPAKARHAPIQLVFHRRNVLQLAALLLGLPPLLAHLHR